MKNCNLHYSQVDFSLYKALFSSPQNPKLFKIFRHIESYGTCMEH